MVIGTILSWGAALAFCAIGIGALVAPNLSSAQYGLPLRDPAALAFVRALGARDFVLGLLIATLAALGEHTALAWSLGIASLAGAADFLIVWRSSPAAPRTSLTVHAVGTLALLVAAAVVR